MTKTIRMIISCLLIFVMISSNIFTTYEAHHECCEEECKICEVITLTSNTIDKASLACFTVVLLNALFVLVEYFVKVIEKHFVFSLVRLKIKLSN